MSRKTTKNEKITVHSADDFADMGKKRLEIKQIRALSQEVVRVPTGGQLPDLSRVTIGDRFAVALRLVPEAHRAALLGKSVQQVRRYEQGSEIPLTVVAALAAETEIPLDWIVTGHAMPRRPPLVYVTPLQPSADGEDVPVQKLAFRASAGNGALALDEAAAHMRFPRAILDHIGVKAQHARLMEAAGESMRPTIADGDLILVDVSATEIVEGKIYVFTIGDEVYVKRLRRAAGQVMMISDNRDLFPDEEAVTPSLPFRVHGRVKWTGRSL